jgi:hypothetical protein
MNGEKAGGSTLQKWGRIGLYPIVDSLSVFREYNNWVMMEIGRTIQLLYDWHGLFRKEECE